MNIWELSSFLAHCRHEKMRSGGAAARENKISCLAVGWTCGSPSRTPTLHPVETETEAASVRAVHPEFTLSINPLIFPSPLADFSSTCVTHRFQR